MSEQSLVLKLAAVALSIVLGWFVQQYVVDKAMAAADLLGRACTRRRTTAGHGQEEEAEQQPAEGSVKTVPMVNGVEEAV